jgi:hypothetical protein
LLFAAVELLALVVLVVSDLFAQETRKATPIAAIVAERIDFFIG